MLWNGKHGGLLVLMSVHVLNKTLNTVLKTLQNAQVKRIYTNGLKNYKYLIDRKIHNVVRFGTNHIERNNLTVRTHIKRLSRKTICFTRNILLLFSVLRIYFWTLR